MTQAGSAGEKDKEQKPDKPDRPKPDPELSDLRTYGVKTKKSY